MYKKNQNIVSRNIHGVFFLIDITENYHDDVCSLFELNDVGEFIWKNMDQVGSVDELAVKLANIISDDIDIEIIKDDINEYIQLLYEKGFLVDNG